MRDRSAAGAPTTEPASDVLRHELRTAYDWLDRALEIGPDKDRRTQMENALHAIVRAQKLLARAEAGT